MDGATLTFGKLFEEARDIAGRYVAAGVRRGDRVVLVLPAGFDFVRHFYALQLLGASSCAMSAQAAHEMTLARATRVKPALIVTNTDELPEAASDVELVRGDPSDVAFLQLTSGTSGEPRLAMVLQRNVLSFCRASTEAMELSTADVFVSWAPPWHDLGLVRFIILPVFAGAACHIVRPAIESIPEWLRTIEVVRGTTTGAPDFAYRLATRMVPAGVDLSSLRMATNGGEPVRASTIEAFEMQFDVRGVLRPGYGLAEATLGVTSVRPGEPLTVDATGAVSCGRPLPGVEVRIDDDGEILVRGETVFAGYFDSEEETARALADGWLHTGDLGRIDANGELYVLGRTRAMIKRGGAVVSPRELEEAALTVRGVKIAAAIGIPSPASAKEQIVVAIEAGAEDRACITAEVADAVFRRLGFAPDRVVVMPSRSIPRTANGKIRHEALRDLLASMNFSSAGPTSPGDSTR